MASSSSSLAPSFLFVFLVAAFSCIAQSAVPPSETFRFVNEGEFGPFIVEYDGNYRVLSIFNSPFQLAFYNTTPNAYTLALRMATTRSESLFRWVWEANRGRPVGENATFSLGTDGNLVLADADGTIAWQTNTANKGVVGFKLLSNGNMVLHDSKGNFIWQSFDSPTDTLLVGQSLRVGGVTKLVSRASEKVNANGAYSLVLEPKRVALYFKSPNSAKSLVYFTSSFISASKNGILANATLTSSPETDENFAWVLNFDLKESNTDFGGGVILARPKYNSTLTFLRLGIDGNVKLFTFYDKVDNGACEETFTMFKREPSFLWDTECQLPERCGSFGVCEDSQCVACPSPNGLLGWSKSCEAKKLTYCRPSDFHYYKIEGVDHFMSKFNKGDRIKEADCEKKCSRDCKCLGYFYHREDSRCWTANDLLTLTKVSNSSHVGFIKTPNK
ncbi:epidermis-specific secreted glycoprotein EP1-like [Carica papaya]|uniref:epidermis-specific secreted glycoprotein EP1-like n=1 Tax=Carica papaya TaxID=3649 RepID=UPI000B8CD0A0|nr:epidermis-specific secreted glycoprotein EP1-like [Carica papaya]